MSYSQNRTMIAEALKLLLNQLDDKNTTKVEVPLANLFGQECILHNLIQSKGLFAKPSTDNQFVIVYKNLPETDPYEISLPYRMLLKIQNFIEFLPPVTKNTPGSKMVIGNRKFLRDLGSFPTIPNRGRTSLERICEQMALPIHSFKKQILKAIEENNVVLIDGDGKIGKSTQIPQYIVDEAAEKQGPCRICSAQPHSLAALSIANRVSYEKGCTLGTYAGYAMPLDSMSSQFTSILYVTLELLFSTVTIEKDPMKAFTHIILDEMYGPCNVLKLALVIMKEKLTRYKNMKLIIIMSRCADVSLYEEFFPQLFRVEVSTLHETTKINVAKLNELYLEDILFGMRDDLMPITKIEVDSPRETIAKAGIKFLTSVDLEQFVRILNGNKFTLNMNKPSNDKEIIDKLLNFALWFGDEKSFRILLNCIRLRYISINYQHSKTLRTVLMIACMKGLKKVVLQLLILGADTTLRCEDGLTASDYGSEDLDIIFMLSRVRSKLDRRGEIYKAIKAIDEKLLKVEEKFESSKLSFLKEYYVSINHDNRYVDYNLLLTLIRNIHIKGKPGSILILLPSLEEIVTVRNMLLADSVCLTLYGGDYLVACLHPIIQKNNAEDTLLEDMVGRKIYLTTGYELIGVHYSDLKHIIDSGYIQKKFRGPNDKGDFRTERISKLCLIERKERVRPEPVIIDSQNLDEFCTKPEELVSRVERTYYHLYSADEADNFKTEDKEIGTALSSVDFQNVFLAFKLIQSHHDLPDDVLMEHCEFNQNQIYQKLESMEMIRSNKVIHLGSLVAHLPVEPRYGKMIIVGLLLKCLDPVLTIAACLSVMPQITSEYHKNETHHVANAWKSFAGDSYSDHMVLHRSFKQRQEEGTKSKDEEFYEHFYAPCGRWELVNVIRTIIVGHLRAVDVIKVRGQGDMRDVNRNSGNWAVVKAALVSAMYPNVAFIDKIEQQIKHRGEEVHLDPMSTLCDLGALNPRGALEEWDLIKNSPTDWIVFDSITNNGLFTKLDICSLVNPITLILFAGNSLTLKKGDGGKKMKMGSNRGSMKKCRPEQLIIIDNWMKFTMKSEEAEILLSLRSRWFDYFEHYVRSCHQEVEEQNNGDLLNEIVKLLTSMEELTGPSQPFPKDQDQKPPSFGVNFKEQPVGTATMRQDGSSSMCGDEDGEMIPVTPIQIEMEVRYFVTTIGATDALAESLEKEVWYFSVGTTRKIVEARQNCFAVIVIFTFDGIHYEGAGNIYNSMVNDGMMKIKWIKQRKVPYIGNYAYYDGQELDASIARPIINRIMN